MREIQNIKNMKYENMKSTNDKKIMKSWECGNVEKMWNIKILNPQKYYKYGKYEIYEKMWKLWENEKKWQIWKLWKIWKSEKYYKIKHVKNMKK